MIDFRSNVGDMINKRQNTRIPISGVANIEFKKHGKIHSIQTVVANISLRGIGIYAYNSMTIKTNECKSTDRINS